MWSPILYIIATALTIPFVVTWLVYKCNRMAKKTQAYAFHKAVNWTTVLYILAVMMICKVIFNQFFIGYVLAFLLAGLMVVIIFQRFNHTEIIFTKACKIVWRVSFLLFTFLYFGLILYGIIQELLTT